MVVGLTGGIASGKSFCTDYFALRHGIDIVDADLIAREVVAKGSEALQALEVAFGSKVIAQDGSLNRPAMRALMLKDVGIRERLNAIVHPRVRQRMLEKVNQLRNKASSYLIMSVPLLLENGLECHTDCTVVIDVTEAQQVYRLRHRDQLSSEQIQQMFNAQMSRTERLARAHFIVDNTSSRQNTQRQLDYLHGVLTGLISTH